MEILKINNLVLTGKIISDRVLLGMHASKRSGNGTEFEQYRHYLPGDDLKRIDWKLYARSGKHLIKESLTDSHLQVRFVLDLTASMNYTEQGLSRLSYAKGLLASLAYLAFRQNDPQSLYFLKGGHLEKIVGEGRGSFQRVLYALENAEAAGSWPATTFPSALPGQRELLIVVSDFLQVEDEWVKTVRRLASPQRQIILFQILGKAERQLDLQGFFRFKDLESGEQVELDAEHARATYVSRFEAYLAQLKEDLVLPHVYLVRAEMGQDLVSVISEGIKAVKR